ICSHMVEPPQFGFDPGASVRLGHRILVRSHDVEGIPGAIPTGDLERRIVEVLDERQRGRLDPEQDQSMAGHLAHAPNLRAPAHM
ncbi:MAG TPA: hypothetical protein VF898_05550, partial [Chloroflexota bacterium]